MNVQYRLALIGLLQRNATQPQRNLALENLAAHIRRVYNIQIDVRIWDMQYQSFDTVVADVVAFTPNLVGLSMPIGTVNTAERFVSALRYQGVQADVIIGGLVATNAPREVAERFPNALIVLGEGERPLEEIVGAYLSDRPEKARSVAGVAFYDSVMHTFHLTPPSRHTVFGGFVEDLWETVIANQGQMVIEGSRGCLAACTFCSSRNLHAQGWTPRPVEEIIAELHNIYARGVRWVFFIDDDFIGKSWERALNLGQQIGRLYPGLTYGISLRADSLTVPEATNYLRILQAHGLTSILMGFESGSTTQLRRFAKRATSAINAVGISVLNAVPNLSYSLGFLIDPLMSRSELLESVEFVLHNGIATRVNHPYGTLDVHKGSRFETMTARAQIQETFDLNTLTWQCHYRDPDVERIMQAVKTLERCFEPAVTQITTELRAITRAPLFDAAKASLAEMLKGDLDAIKIIQFQILHHAALHPELLDYPANSLNALLDWMHQIQVRYDQLLPTVSKIAAQCEGFLVALGGQKRSIYV